MGIKIIMMVVGIGLSVSCIIGAIIALTGKGLSEPSRTGTEIILLINSIAAGILGVITFLRFFF